MLLFISAFVITTEMKERIAHTELLAVMDSGVENTITFSCFSNGESNRFQDLRLTWLKLKGQNPQKA